MPEKLDEHAQCAPGRSGRDVLPLPGENCVRGELRGL